MPPKQTAQFEAALEYHDRGLSIIPVQRNKKPYIPWEEYQTKRADTDTIKRWFRTYPDAGVAIVTGPISGVDVVDVDSTEAEDRLVSELGDQLTYLALPIAKTPRGKHLYFKATGEGNKTGILEGVDYRGKGGYVVAPPSHGSNGKGYSWLEGASILQCETPPAPAALSLLINSFNKHAGGGLGDNYSSQPLVHKCPQTSTSVHMKFEQGYRDNTLFHIANCLIKGGMPPEEIEQFLTVIAHKICNPPFPKKEIPSKIKSALNRAASRERNLAQEIREWVLSTSGHIMSTDVHNCLHLSTRREKKTASMVMRRLVEEGILENAGNRAGCYRRVERDYEVVDLDALEEGNPIDVKLPFRMENLVELMPKDLVVFAGTPNAGKTALMLEAVRLNMYRHRCFYFSSELGRHAAKKRLKKHEECKKWNFKFIDDFPNYLDVIQPDDFNFIDYVEVAEGEFYKIPSILSGIQRKLKSGIAFVALQKNPGLAHAVGGPQTRAKPALFCTIEEKYPGAEICINKGKNWVRDNPNGLIHKFKIVGGINIVTDGGWYRQ
jgi:hypothetical protein